MTEAKTIDSWIMLRNEVQFEAENMGEAVADECWRGLGVANRHIIRVVDGLLPLTPVLEREIEDCLERTGAWLKGLDETADHAQSD